MKTKRNILNLVLASAIVGSMVMVSGTGVLAAKRDGWMRTSAGWSYYQKGVEISNTWKKIGGKWYYLERNGNMKTSWLFDENYKKWYYLDATGAMKTGWLKSGTKWFYLYDTNDAYRGQMATGWVKINGSWYYFDNDNGQMRVNTWIDGFTRDFRYDDYRDNTMKKPHYYIGADGKYVANPQMKYNGQIGSWSSDGKYFYTSDGLLVNGFEMINGKMYVFLPELKKGYYQDPITTSLHYSDENGVYQYSEPINKDSDNIMTTKRGDKVRILSDDNLTVTVIEKAQK